MKKYKKIVFITDKERDNRKFGLMYRDGEGNSKRGILELSEALKSISDNFIFIDDIQNFVNNLNNYKDSIVVSTYYGEASNNSKILIPAICEANHIPYIGANSYLHGVFNDKYLTKSILKSFNIKTPKCIIIYRSENSSTYKERIQKLNLPLIVKPNFGGGSNGITEKSLVYSYEEALKIIQKLLKFQNIPVIVEEYIEGFEFEYIIFGNKNNICIEGEVQLSIDNNTYFKDKIFSLESKKQKKHKINMINSSLTPENDKEKFRKFFLSFDKLEIVRIDCRSNKNGVYVIEISPDCYLGKTGGGVATVFKNNSITYEEMLCKLIQNALKSQ